MDSDDGVAETAVSPEFEELVPATLPDGWERCGGGAVDGGWSQSFGRTSEQADCRVVVTMTSAVEPWSCGDGPDYYEEGDEPGDFWLDADWSLFVMVGGREYHLVDTERLDPGDVGNLLGRVCADPSAGLVPKSYVIQNGDAAYIDRGSEVRTIDGIDPSLRVAVIDEDGVTRPYEVRPLPQEPPRSDGVLSETVSDMTDRPASFEPTGPVGGHAALGCGDVGAEFPRSPAELASWSDLVVAGAVTKVHSGRANEGSSTEATSRSFLSVVLEIETPMTLSGGHPGGSVFIELEVCNIPGDGGPSGPAAVAAAMPAMSTAVWFLVDATDWEPLPEQRVTWVDDDPIAGDATVYHPMVAGIIYENADGTVSTSHTATPESLGTGWQAFFDLPAADLVRTIEVAIGS